MSDGLFSMVGFAKDAGAGYRLDYLEVFNWGTFDGQISRLRLDAQTSLLTGDIGSGKSTLVDALTTLLMPAHRIAYNKAAGADSRERTLRSYVEGHYKSERVESSGRSRSVGLRTSAPTYSVILGVFTNKGYSETVSLAQVFQQRNSAGQPYRFFVTAREALSILGDFSDFGSALPELRKRLRAAGAEIFDEFPKYATSVRRLLGIRSEQAMELFHQTVSMKSVGNLNDFVRDHMLEPSDSSQRLREIIGHFEDLTRAHDAVKRAKEQLEALAPVAADAGKYDRALATSDAARAEQAAIPLFIAEFRLTLLADEIAQLAAREQELLASKDAAESESHRLQAAHDALIEERAQAGGDRLGQLEREAEHARTEAACRSETRAGFDAAVSRAEFAQVTGPNDFALMVTGVAEELPRLKVETDQLRHAENDAIGRQKDAERRVAPISEELNSLTQRTSLLPATQIDLRAQLCEALQVPVEDLPYAGELLDVHGEHAQWRGAAERVLRGFALSLLVPQRHYDAVTTWVNERRLSRRGGEVIGARLTYERVSDRRMPMQPTSTGALLLADCIEIKVGAFADYLSGEIVRRADHHCATTLEEFRSQRRAVTQQGQVRSGDRHEKDDRNAVDDPKSWVLGWANERKIAALRAEQQKLQSEGEQAWAEASEATSNREKIQVRIDALNQLSAYPSWIPLDVEEAKQRARAADEERARIEAGSSRLTEIADALVQNASESAALALRLAMLSKELGKTDQATEDANGRKRQDDGYVSQQPESAKVAARKCYSDLTDQLAGDIPSKSEDCIDAESILFEALTKRIDDGNTRLASVTSSLGKHMNAVLLSWPELRADLDADVESRAEFVALRDRVANDDLPGFESEFKEQLNKNAIQELAGFHNWLSRQASSIDERIDRINEALGAVPYNPGRYIRLEKELTTNQEVVAFRSDLRNVTNDSLVIDGDLYSEQRFLDVKRIIERLRGREGYAEADKTWTRRVTDVRNWFVFSASERDLETHSEWEHYSDSDGKSGGQKEKLAYTILAASLAYQFGLEWGAVKAKDFRFAVIDEAFGRGSDASARYALRLFAELGLQLLIVTPHQKVHVIEPFVKSIGFVENRTGTASRLVTISIEEYFERRDGPRS